jgi:hypothetical protein
VKRSRAGWPRVISRTIWRELQVVPLVLLNIGERVENNEQPDDHYEGQKNRESLAHRQLVTFRL